jgi:hypothetical protein
VKESLENISEENATETITCKQCLTDRSTTLETIIISSEDFLDTLIDNYQLYYNIPLWLHSKVNFSMICNLPSNYANV